MAIQTLPSEIELDRELCKRSFAYFCRLGWHVLEPSTPLKWGWALDAICEHLQAVHDGQINRLLINVPPGCMKSLTTSVFFPAWEWGAGGRPSITTLSTSHNEKLSLRDNLKCRRLISDTWYQERWPLKITSDQNEKRKFENEKRGIREVSSIESMTGSRGDRVIVDDPLSVDDAFSATVLESRARTFKEAITTRVNDPEKSAIIVIMQRLHEKDISGIILDEALGYEHLMLPMFFEPKRKCFTSIGFKDPRTEDGELLFPERFPADVVERDCKIIGEYAVAGQYQQRPTPAGGAIFKEDWFRYYTASDLPDEWDEVVQSWDMTFKDTKTSDYVVGQVWGRKGANYYLLYQDRDRYSFTDSISRMLAVSELYPESTKKLVEDKANGSAIIDTLKNDVSGICPVTPKESKIARASAVTPLFRAGNVWFPMPESQPWVKTLKAELLSFPNGAHDDMVDALTQALNDMEHDKPFAIHPDIMRRIRR